MAAHVVSLCIKFALLNSFAETYCTPKWSQPWEATTIATLLICGVCAFVAHTFNKSQAEVYRTTHDTFKDASYSTFTAPPVQVNQSAVHAPTSQY
ncbi:hypothetical protein PROFUN_08205 [Planoprotostelium fungivorum]|uniref:Uncharacterized protein n=1 Tax=Planoprotostelium fungivorum TaxID=1890364 RepID=A0A2P6N668_9EUKA|nr:hypothetical protein PROFUN_08205 [Planoprotostelium fungivorum]